MPRAARLAHACTMDVTFLGAVLAGVLSFFSPCVLPLVIPYLGFLGGLTLEAGETGVQAGGDRARLMRATLVFVLGFATVFTALGATASAMAGLLAEYRDAFAIVGGIVLILFGLHMAEVLQIRILNYEMRFQVQKRPVTLGECYVIGLAFGFGWTPCVGAVLAGILMLAAAEGSALHGALLLLAYAGGIGIPFLVAAALATRFLGFVRRMHGHMHRVRLALAGLLILSGILLLTGGFGEIAQWLIDRWPGLGRLG